MQGSLSTEFEGAIAIITFSHPDHNALPSALLHGLTQALIKCGQDDSVKLIVLKAAGDRTFCAGANLSELSVIDDREKAVQFFRGFGQVINAIRSCGKLVIGRVQGKAVGGGVGIIGACDYVMATKWGSVRLSEISIGIGPFVIEPAIRRKIGLSHFSKLALNPTEWQIARWAHEVGLYQELFDTVEQLDDYLERYLARMVTYSSQALAQMKLTLWEGTEEWVQLLHDRAERSGQLLLSEEAQEALAKIRAKSRT